MDRDRLRDVRRSGRRAAAAGHGPRSQVHHRGTTSFCEGFVDRGFFVIRFDNRDVGLSTKIDAPTSTWRARSSKAIAGERSTRRTCSPTWPPTPSACSTHLGIDAGPRRRRVDGRDDRPDDGHRASRRGCARSRRSCRRPATATSASRTPEAAASLLQAAAEDRDAYIEQSSRRGGSSAARCTSTRSASARERPTAYDRCYYPAGHRPPAPRHRWHRAREPTRSGSSTCRRS